MDFTLNKYKEVLSAIGRGDFRLISFLNSNSQRFILRHDVDRAPGSALKMAKLENSSGVKASYYFRVPFGARVAERIAKWGHEIGYQPG